MEITAAVVRKFVPVTIILNTEVEVANLLGALIAYGTANVYAENALKAVGLGEFYSGNVRKAARQIAMAIAGKAELGVSGLEATLEAYLNSDKFRSSAPSQAGSKAIGTTEDLAPGRAATTFESGNADAPETDEFGDVTDEYADGYNDSIEDEEYFG
jgi:hypothetical protein